MKQKIVKPFYIIPIAKSIINLGSFAEILIK